MKKNNRKKKLSTTKILLIFLVLCISITFFIKYSHGSKERAVEGAACTNLPLSVPVLVLSFYPRDSANPSMLDKTETNMQQTVADTQSHVQDMITQNIAFLKEATKYHGYKNASAQQFLDFSVYDQKEYFTKIPQGYQLSWAPFAHRPDHGQILRNVNICDYVDNKGVREVWMYGYHSNTIEPDESRMSSMYGDISNSLPHDEQVPSQYRMPVCQHAYTFYNYNYSRGVETEAHDRLHQVENMMSYAEGAGKWPPTVNPNNTTGSIFWGNFSIYVQSNTPVPTKTACGNAHFTPNWKSASQDSYRYNVTGTVSSNCENWPQNNYATVSCSNWGCSEMGYYTWWLQNIPGYNNGISMNGQPMRNWWEAMYDFNNFISKGRTLFGTSSITGCVNTNPTATSAPSPTLTPTPIPTQAPVVFFQQNPTAIPTQSSLQPAPTSSSRPVVTSSPQKNTESPATSPVKEGTYTPEKNQPIDVSSFVTFETPTPPAQKSTITFIQSVFTDNIIPFFKKLFTFSF